MAEATRKPNSVPGSGYPEPGDDHSSKDADCSTPLATYPGARAGSPRSLPYLVLHRVGFTKLPRSPGELVRSYRTFSPLPLQTAPPRRTRSTVAVSFLWHFPSRRHDSTLWSILPCGVRTFLRPPCGSRRSSELLRPFIGSLPINYSLTAGAPFQAVFALQFIIHLRGDIHEAPLTDGADHSDYSAPVRLLQFDAVKYGQQIIGDLSA